MPEIGRILMIFGVAIFVVGLLLAMSGRAPVFGNLPGDIRWQRGGATVFVPLGSMIVLSIILSLLLNLLARFWR